MRDPDIIEAWSRGADHYATRPDEGAATRLANLVLANYCTYQWSGGHGGPSLEMVHLAENILGKRLDEVIGDFLTAIQDEKLQGNTHKSVATTMVKAVSR